MSEFAIQTHDLKKFYKNLAAVNGLNLKVPRGGVYGFLGRNGAGKTTTIKTLLGLVRASEGSAEVLGLDIKRDTIEILRRTGFVSDSKAVFDGLTPAELVRFNRPYFPKWSDKLVERYSRFFEIPMDRRVRELSLGNRTKVCLLLALCQGADLLVLDEPTTGLDPVMVDRLMRTLIEDHAGEGQTIFVSSHHLPDIERIADWVGIIEGGRLLLETTLEDVRQDFRMVTVSGGAALEQLANVATREQSGNFTRYLVTRQAEAFAAEARAAGGTIVEIAPVSLNEVFLGMVRKEETCIAGSSGMIPATV